MKCITMEHTSTEKRNCHFLNWCALYLINEYPFPEEDLGLYTPRELRDALIFLSGIYINHGMRYGRPAIEFLETLTRKYPENEEIGRTFELGLTRMLFFNGAGGDQMSEEDKRQFAEKLYSFCATRVHHVWGRCSLNGKEKDGLGKINPELLKEFEKLTLQIE